MVGTRRSPIFLFLSGIIILIYLSFPKPFDVGLRQSWQSKPSNVGTSPLKGTTQFNIAEQQEATTSAPVATSISLFEEDRWFFQEDLKDYANPSYDVAKLRQFQHQNAQEPGHATYGIYYSTRNATLQDPYFLAAQQVIYRLLWDARSRSTRHPVTVWVAPFVPDEHRDLFRAAGADVRELALIEWNPKAVTKERWKDTFAKLNLWNETSYSRIVFLDLDAFPLENVDGLFDIAEEEQRCSQDMLPFEDKLAGDDLCDYVFVGAHGEDREINVGVVVLKPSQGMHARLLREYEDERTEFDHSMAEQAFLSWHYDPEGPFPVHWIDREWNALFTKPPDEGRIKIIHEKLWAFWFVPEHFAAKYFEETWADMLALYNSKEFEDMRAAAGSRVSS